MKDGFIIPELGLTCNEENLAFSASSDNNKVNEIFRKMVHLKLLMRDIKTKSEAFVTKITNIIRWSILLLLILDIFSTDNLICP